MSKYEKLWIWISDSGESSLKLTFDVIEEIAGVKIDHSFLRYKNELTERGYKVIKINMKEKNVSVEKYYRYDGRRPI